MSNKVLEVRDIITEDQLANEIAQTFFLWDNARIENKRSWKEVQDFVFATDTKTTTVNKLDWSNSTHIPKICNIRDNLLANYLASMFPKRRWLKWIGKTKDDQTRDKENAIIDYMSWCIQQKSFEEEIIKLVSDYIDYGNAFATVEWVDETQLLDTGERQPGYVGPKVRRISPYDIVMNPTAKSFYNTPKIEQSIMSLGEAKSYLDEGSSFTLEQKEIAKKVWGDLLKLRTTVGSHKGMMTNDSYKNVKGFSTYMDYLKSDYMELLTFTGDYYNKHEDKFYKNYTIIVADRCKVIYQGYHQSPTGEIPIFHSGWRVKQDNLWAMGPLENLVGMQYRIDHIENMKADLFDLTNYPPIKVRGNVTDFEWGPGELIYVGDNGDVELMSPRPDLANANFEIDRYQAQMEEMAGAPKEAMGFRTAGEKTMYEVQRLENAASRMFQVKIKQFEKQLLEPLLNAMLATARLNLTSQTVRLVEDEFKSVSFKDITRHDLSAMGLLKPIAARHFAEQAELVQNITSFYQGPLGADQEIRMHLSPLKLAQLFEDVLNLEDYEIVSKNIRLSEQAELQQEQNALQEHVSMTAQTPSGLNPYDTSEGMNEIQSGMV